jgi:hypothetical protein
MERCNGKILLSFLWQEGQRDLLVTPAEEGPSVYKGFIEENVCELGLARMMVCEMH